MSLKSQEMINSFSDQPVAKEMRRSEKFLAYISEKIYKLCIAALLVLAGDIGGDAFKFLVQLLTA